MLLSLWVTTSKCRGTMHDIRAYVPLIDSMLANAKVPSEVRRTPLGISEMKHWKGVLILLHSCFSTCRSKYIIAMP